MRLWLDDIRLPPPGWRRAHSVNEAIRLLSDHDCEWASLDHDLGDYADDGGDGYRLVLWMAETQTWPTRGVRVHSANAPGLSRMLKDIDHYGPYPRGYGISRGDPIPP
jgi:hypothetical protein